MKNGASGNGRAEGLRWVGSGHFYVDALSSDLMSIHGQAELDREARRVARSTRASLMSDTKWRRVFEAVGSHPEFGIRQCVFKFLELDEERVASPVVGFYPPRPWIDSSSFGPFPLRSIEWLLFPRKASYQVDPRFPPRFESQDVEGARDVLDRLGKLPLEVTERGLVVRGYLPAK